ncbi:threonine/serine exporter family protein [Acetobacterium woodii]|uniref:Putative membrane protein n=1 Tax=Acetobacterium woodii (strain ATCC 29683 / DSM 1030 / JCM 2381 / KCTC 1655 / WB1) TaxID=931626 RepID=H6LF68_ACEWD|nr:threonine/serine exporter family protein [Acetobacterium woodii]AFA48168.1 putative membrane protein [Acetobacterium woodii DSM 1030]
MYYITPCLYAFIASFAFAIIFNIPKNKLLLSALGGMLGQLIYVIFQLIIANDVVLYLLATISIALYAEIMARVTKSPTTIYLAVALIPLVPGGGIYYTMLYFINGETELGVSTGIHTLLVSGALAIGIIIVSSTINLIRKVMIKNSKRKKHKRPPKTKIIFTKKN